MLATYPSVAEIEDVSRVCVTCVHVVLKIIQRRARVVKLHAEC